MKQVRLTSVDVEQRVRAELGTDGAMRFIGYAAVYNSISRLIIEGGRVFNEILEPGCFDRVLADEKKDIVLTVNHDRKMNLGRTISGNLMLQSDEIGLRFIASVPNTTLGRDTFEMIKRGDYTDCSFCFSVDDKGESWETGDEGGLVHRVKEVSGLYDVAICTVHGAYEQTVVDVERAVRMYDEKEREKEQAIREAEQKKSEEANALHQEYRKTVTNSLRG